MSGRGKGGKGLGKGGAKRHRKVLRDNIQGITKPAIRRLARRGGIKRISGLIYEETRGVLKVLLENVIRDAVTYTEHARRKTVTAMDIVMALKRQGRILYGFGPVSKADGVTGFIQPEKRKKTPKCSFNTIANTFVDVAKSASAARQAKGVFCAAKKLPCALPSYDSLLETLIAYCTAQHPTWDSVLKTSKKGKYPKDYNQTEFLISDDGHLFAEMLNAVARRQGRDSTLPRDGAASSQMSKRSNIVSELFTPLFQGQGTVMPSYIKAYVLSKPQGGNMTLHTDKNDQLSVVGAKDDLQIDTQGHMMTDVVFYLIMGPDKAASKFFLFKWTGAAGQKALEDIDARIKFQCTGQPTQLGVVVTDDLPTMLREGDDGDDGDAVYTISDVAKSEIETYSVWATRGYVLAFDASELHGVANHYNYTGNPQLAFGINMGRPNGLVHDDAIQRRGGGGSGNGLRRSSRR